MNYLNTKIKELAHSLGVEINRYNPQHTQFGRLVTALHQFKIDKILDVGANEGQFGIELRKAGYNEKLISFEPLKDAHNKLLSISKNDYSWLVYDRCAVGDRNGQIEINISANSVSSSILPMMDSHKKAAPDSGYIGKEKCSLIALDSVRSELVEPAESFLIKIDTQGYEWQVLDGAEELLKKAKGVFLEMSLVELYQGQVLWTDVIARLELYGFTLWSLQPAFINPHNGRTMQVDGLFFRV